MIQELMRRLLRSDPIKINDKAKVISLLHTRELWGPFADILYEVNSPKQLLSYECLKYLGDIIRFPLTCK